MEVDGPLDDHVPCTNRGPGVYGDRPIGGDLKAKLYGL